jgi:hypothetical protein
MKLWEEENKKLRKEREEERNKMEKLEIDF